jgi:hypothetical protein
MDKGSKIIQGNFSISSLGGDLYESGDERLLMIQVTPSYSAFVIPGVAIGGRIIYYHSSQGTRSSTGWGIGPQLTIFFSASEPPETIEKNSFPYFSAAFLYSNSTLKISETFNGFTDTYESTTTNTVLSFGLGWMYMLSNYIAIDSELTYNIENYSRESSDSSISGNQINFLIGITAFLY